MKLHQSSLVRWLAPLTVAGLLVGGSLGVNAISAAAGGAALPARTAAELLVDVQQAKVTALSGTVVQTSDLGIPALPGVGGGNSSNLTSLVSGTHTLRVWYDGNKARLALLGRLGESDVIKNGSDLWTWSSQTNTATHRVLSRSAAGPTTKKSPMGVDPTDLPKTPKDAAAAVLAAIDPSTLVSTDASTKVAGRPAYQLTLRPRQTAGSLVAGVSIAIDGATHIPLRVQIFAVGHTDAAFQVAFQSVDLSAPDAAQFTFNPPAGVAVTPEKADPMTARPESGSAESAGMPGAPKVVGSGWTSVLVASSSALPTSGQLGRVLSALPRVSGSWGSGSLLSGRLFSVLITDSGKVALGAVQPKVLYAALAAK